MGPGEVSAARERCDATGHPGVLPQRLVRALQVLEPSPLRLEVVLSVHDGVAEPPGGGAVDLDELLEDQLPALVADPVWEGQCRRRLLGAAAAAARVLGA